MKSTHCILYSKIRPDIYYVAEAALAMEQSEWQRQIDRACERYRQIKRYLNLGVIPQIQIPEEEMLAFENGTVGLFAYMFPEFKVTPRAVVRALYDP